LRRLRQLQLSAARFRPVNTNHRTDRDFWIDEYAFLSRLSIDRLSIFLPMAKLSYGNTGQANSEFLEMSY
jgi:hypothetical protein